MRRLLVVALLLAGLCAPPAVLAQIGSTPGITGGTVSPTFSGTAKFGSGTCASSGAVPFTGGTPSISFTADTDSGFCWDTAGGTAGNIGIAIIKDGRQLARLARGGGTLYGHNTGGTLKAQAFGWDLSGGIMYGWDATGATQRTIGTWSYDTAATPTPGFLTLNENVGLAFQGSALDTNLTTITVTNPTANRTFTIPNFSGTALVSSTANEPDTGNAVWANTGSFLFEGSTANGFETELDTVDPTADRTIYLPDSSGTVLVAEPLNAPIGVTVTEGEYSTLYKRGAGATQTLLTYDPAPPGGGDAYSMDFNASYGSFGITATDPAGATSFYIAGTSTTLNRAAVMSRYVGNVTTILGGYALPGVPTDPAKTVAVTIVDTTPSITDGDVQICGVASLLDPPDIWFCETLDFSGGAGTLTTTATFAAVYAVKSSSFATLGGAGDETIAVQYTAGPGILSPASQNVANHPASDYVSTPWSPGSLYSPNIRLNCLDLAGCEYQLAAGIAGTGDFVEVTIYVVDGSNTVTLKDADGVQDLAGDADLALGPADVVKLLYDTTDTRWAEVSRSNN